MRWCLFQKKRPRCEVVKLLPSRPLAQNCQRPPSVSCCTALVSVFSAPIGATENGRNGQPIQQADKKGNKSEDTARLSEELFGLLSADGAKPDDDVVMEKIEELEVCFVYPIS